MSSDDPIIDTVHGVAEGLRSDIVEADWFMRVQTIALSAGLMAFGVALGVRWAAVDTINYFGPIDPFAPPPEHVVPLSQLYNDHMRLALGVAAVALIVGVAMDIYSRGESK
jgi:hypothetical protein